VNHKPAVFLVAVLAMAGHLIAGWVWVIPAAMIGGAAVASRGWLVGMSGVGLSWTGLVIFNFVAAPGPTVEMTRVMGALAGNLPGAAIVGLTLLSALTLGAAGGYFGASLRNIRR